MKILFFLFFTYVSIFIISCDSNPTDSIYVVNPNIKKIVDSYTDKKYPGYYISSNVSDNLIYASTPVREFKINSEWQVLEDTTLILKEFWSYIYYWNTKLLLVKSIYTDISCGGLYEYNLENNTMNCLLDEKYNISSALYNKSIFNSVIFYSYGKHGELEPGYYKLNILTKEINLILEFSSELNKAEILNGFDYNDINNILLIPLTRGSLINNVPPLILEYNLNEKTLDTLDVDLNLSSTATHLWLRYNQSFDKILFCLYPEGIYGYTVNSNSIVGIVNINSNQITTYDLLTNEDALQGHLNSIQIFPTWINGDNGILFNSAKVSYEGAKSNYSIYMLNLN